MTDEPTEGVLATPSGGTEYRTDYRVHEGIPAIAKSEHDRIVAELQAEVERWRRMEAFVLNTMPGDGPALIELAERGGKAVAAERQRILAIVRDVARAPDRFTDDLAMLDHIEAAILAPHPGEQHDS
jgi:hypothetical protein